MPRHLRSDPTDGWHHVTNLGARHYATFIDDGDRANFLELLAESCDANGVEVVAYCLMGNHFHLVLHCPSGNLSATMQQFASCYVRSFNFAHGFSGALFQDRYFNKLNTSEESLLQTTRYVHRNPLELGLDITRYPWSSYLAFAGLVRSPAWLASSVPLGVAGGMRSYQSFVETDMASDKTSITDGLREQGPQPRPTRRRTFLEPIDTIVAGVVGVPVSEVLSTGRGRKNVARTLAVLVAIDLGADIRDVAAHYNFSSPSRVRTQITRARRSVESDPVLANAFYRVINELDGSDTRPLAG